MVSSLSSSHLRLPKDLRKLKKSIHWQVTGYEHKVRHRIILLTGLRPGEFMHFSAEARTGLVLPFSSFFFTLLETYVLWESFIKHTKILFKL
jgi:hypothetical protein